MTLELVQAHPATGEVIDLASPTEDLARLVDQIRDLEWRARQAKRAVTDELLRRMDRERVWTLETPDFKVSGKSDRPVKHWKVEQTRETLDQLAAEGLITQEAAGRAVQPRVEYRVMAKGMNALLASPDLAARLADCFTEGPPDDRTVRLEARSGR